MDTKKHIYYFQKFLKFFLVEEKTFTLNKIPNPPPHKEEEKLQNDGRKIDQLT